MLGLIITTAVAGGVHAQQQARERGTQVSLEEIVITAQRRTRSLQTEAVSATVLTGGALDSKGVNQLLDLQYAAPTLTVSHYGSANVTTIRGIGRSQVDIDVPSGVVIYRDGAPTFGGYFQNEPYFDIESVEVLRGPQGTFVGQSAAGGAIFINTNDPILGEFSGSVEGGIGNYDRFEAEFILNIPVSDTLAIRTAYHHEEYSDFWDEITGDFIGNPGDVDNHSYRFGAKWQPSDNFTSTLKVDYHDLDFGGSLVYSFGVEPLETIEQNGRINYKDESIRTVLEMQYFFDNGIEIRSLSNYQHVDTINHQDLNASEPWFYQFLSDFSVETWSQEINLISPEENRFTYILGAFYQEQSVRLPRWQEDGFAFVGGVQGNTPDMFPGDGPAAPAFVVGSDFPWLASPWFQDQQFVGLFAHFTYDLTNRLTFELGGRYNYYKVTAFTEWVFGDGTVPPTLPFAPPGTDRYTEEEPDGQAVLNWNVTDEHFLYALASRGHNTGGINIFPPFRVYGAMEVWNFEGGWKANWFDDRLRTQFSGYYQRIDDYQANFDTADSPEIGQDNRTADGISTIWGLEFSAQASVGAWSVDASIAYMNSQLGTFEDVLSPFIPDDPATPELENRINLSGAKVPFAPEINVNFGIGYDMAMGDGYTLTPRVDVSHQGNSRGALWTDELVLIESRTLINARLTLTPPNDAWTAVLWVNNLEDDHYTAGVQNNGTLRRAGRPREFGIRMRYKF